MRWQYSVYNVCLYYRFQDSVYHQQHYQNQQKNLKTNHQRKRLKHKHLHIVVELCRYVAVYRQDWFFRGVGVIGVYYHCQLFFSYIMTTRLNVGRKPIQLSGTNWSNHQPWPWLGVWTKHLRQVLGCEPRVLRSIFFLDNSQVYGLLIVIHIKLVGSFDF